MFLLVFPQANVSKLLADANIPRMYFHVRPVCVPASALSHKSHGPHVFTRVQRSGETQIHIEVRCYKSGDYGS